MVPLEAARARSAPLLLNGMVPLEAAIASAGKNYKTFVVIYSGFDHIF